jgi:anti-sigma regulatory factor (Ser/Thr protein kinase)
MPSARQEYGSDLQQLPLMRAFVHNVCCQAWDAAANEEALAQLDLALQEAASNIVLHAYRGEKGRPIELVVEACADQVCVSLYHAGLDFDPDAVPPPAFDGSRTCGFGLYLIKQLVDEVQFFRDDRQRCGVRLRKRRRRI